jgi:sialic acid synthase SpsE
MACIPQYPAFNFKVPNQLDHILDIDAGEIVGGWDALWGWSSHTPDYLDVLLAVSRGAAVVEKHVRGSIYDNEAGWSLGFDEFGKMVADIRRVETMR